MISISIWQFSASASCVKRCRTKVTSFNSTSCEWGHGLKTAVTNKIPSSRI